MNAVEISNFKYCHSRVRLSFDALSIRSGKKTGILSAKNGGAAELLAIIARQLEPDSAVIKLLGQKPEQKTMSQIAFVSSVIGFAPNCKLSVIKKDYNRFFDTFDNQLFDELITKYGLNLNSTLSSLNKAQLCKFSFMLAACRQPAVYLVDLTGFEVDPIVINEVMSLLSRHMRSDATLIFATTRMGDIDKFAEDAVIVSHAGIVFGGEFDSYCGECYVFTGSALPESDGLIGYGENDGVCDFMVNTADKKEQLLKNYPNLSCDKADRLAVLTYLIKEGGKNE